MGVADSSGDLDRRLDMLVSAAHELGHLGQPPRLDVLNGQVCSSLKQILTLRGMKFLWLYPHQEQSPKPQKS